MFKLRNLGLVLASLVTALAISGAAALIALDFAGIDGLAHAWSTLTGWVLHAASPTPRAFSLDGARRIAP